MKSISWGWRIIILYAIFIAGTIGWVSYAMTKEVDLVRPDYYEHGLDHDQTMVARARADALGANACIMFDRNEQSLRIQVPREQVPGAKGSVSLYRPNAVDSDRTIAFMPGKDGIMTISSQSLAKGVWHVTIDWKANNLDYELTRVDTL